MSTNITSTPLMTVFELILEIKVGRRLAAEAAADY
jgi:hypothetical protein